MYTGTMQRRSPWMRPIASPVGCQRGHWTTMMAITRHTMWSRGSPAPVRVGLSIRPWPVIGGRIVCRSLKGRVGQKSAISSAGESEPSNTAVACDWRPNCPPLIEGGEWGKRTAINSAGESGPSNTAVACDWRPNCPPLIEGESGGRGRL